MSLQPPSSLPPSRQRSAMRRRPSRGGPPSERAPSPGSARSFVRPARQDRLTLGVLRSAACTNPDVRFDGSPSLNDWSRSTTMARKPVAAAVVSSFLMVVCDDGAVYELDPDGAWVVRRPMPGTASAHAYEIRSQDSRFD